MLRQVLVADKDFIEVHRLVRRRSTPAPPPPPLTVSLRTRGIMLLLVLLPVLGVVSSTVWSIARDRHEAHLMDLSRTIALDLCDRDRWAAVERTWQGSRIETDPGRGRRIPTFYCTVAATLPLEDGTELELHLSLYAREAETPGEYRCADLDSGNGSAYREGPQPICVVRGAEALDGLEGAALRGTWDLSLRLTVYGSATPTPEESELAEQATAALLDPIDLYPLGPDRLRSEASPGLADAPGRCGRIARSVPKPGSYQFVMKLLFVLIGS